MSATQTKIQRAILSVTDKTGLVEFARKLAGLGVELISTGGTAKLLRDSGIAVKDISDLTGFPEMLDGRVKTLHPKVHGGILHRREKASHRTAVAEHGIQPIDMVVVNLYAFEKTAAKPGVHFEELIENIDIGGPSMIRSAAKNFQDVAVVTSPADYDSIAEEMAKSGGALSPATKWRLAQKAFATTAAYDSAIASTLERVSANGQFRVPARSRLPAESAPVVPAKSWTCATERTRIRRPRMYSDGSGSGVANGTATPRQGTFLQQHRGPASRLGPGAGIRRDRLRHHQAHESLRHRDRQDSGRGLQESAGMRSGIGFRRRDRREPPRGWRSRRRNGQAFSRSHRRARVSTKPPRRSSPLRKICVWSKSANAPQKWVLKNVSGGILVQDADTRALDRSRS